MATAQLPSAIRVPRFGELHARSRRSASKERAAARPRTDQRERWRRPNSSDAIWIPRPGGFMRGSGRELPALGGRERGPPPTAAQWATTTAGDDPVMSPVLPRYPGPGSFMPGEGPGGVGKLTTDRRVGRRKEHSSDKPPR